MKDDYSVTADCFQQLAPKAKEGMRFVPILRINGKVTTIGEDPPKTYGTAAIALKVARKARLEVMKKGLAKRPPREKRMDVGAKLTAIADDITTVVCACRDNEVLTNLCENDFYAIKSMAIFLNKIVTRLNEEGE
jgi:hypothetical protein